MKGADEIKAQYKSNSVHKNLIVRFPELNVQTEHKNLHQNSMRLKESLFDKDSIEFVGCIASIFQIDIEMLSEDVKGKRIEVEIYTDAYPNSPISLFHGIVDSALKQANSRTKEIVAYDELYTKGNINVVPWYKSLGFPITLKEVRDSLFDYIGLAQEPSELPCDSVQIKKQYKPSSLQAVSVIKAICQINGVFGIINRQGRFEYRIPSNTAAQSITAPYPSTTLFPSGILLPAGAAQEAGETARLAEKMHVESFSFYKSVSHEEFVVRPVDMVTIRNSEDSEGVSYKGSDSAGINNYIIQGNMFTYGLTDDVLLEIAEKIYRNVSGFEYMPFQSDNNGLPYIECGLDTVDYIMIDYDKSTGGDIVYKRKAFHVLDRELTGIQALRDNYSAKGEEYQTEFITDLQTQIDLLKKKNSQEAQETQQQMKDYTYSREEIDQKFDSGGSKWEVVSVPVLPTTIAANTIYLIQGEVVVE